MSDLSQSQFDKLPKKLQDELRKLGAYPTDLVPSAAKMPYTAAGAPSLKGAFDMKGMTKDIDGVVVREENNPVSSNSAMLLQPAAHRDTPAHEMEHALANQGLGASSRLNSLWDQTVGTEGAQRGEIVQRLIAHAPYLAKTYGLDPKDIESGYFSPTVLKRQDKNNFLYEQMATLSALEQRTNKRLVDDPYVRKNILTTPAERETYDALTGLRQTRLDAKDLPPYTRIPEKKQAPTGMWDAVQKKMKDVF